MDDTLTAHLDAIEAEAGAFVLTREKSGWTATATRKLSRKPALATGATALEAVANLLTALRGEADKAPAADEG